MTDPPRLSKTGDAFDAQLLCAAKAETPRDGNKKKVIAAVALLATGLAVEKTSTWSHWKRLGTFAIAAIGVGAAYLAQSGPPSHSHPPAVASAAPTVLAPSEAPAPPTQHDDAPGPPEWPAVHVPAQRAPAPARPPRANDERDAGAQAELQEPAAASTTAAPPTEIEMLSEAKFLMKSRTPDAALAALARYERTFPRGTLAEEAWVLRVEALSASGQKQAAAMAARAFLEKHPKSAYTVRVKALLEDVTR